MKIEKNGKFHKVTNEAKKKAKTELNKLAGKKFSQLSQAEKDTALIAVLQSLGYVDDKEIFVFTAQADL